MRIMVLILALISIVPIEAQAARKGKETKYCQVLRESALRAYEKAGEDEAQLAQNFAPLALLIRDFGCSYKKFLYDLGKIEPGEASDEK